MYPSPRYSRALFTNPLQLPIVYVILIILNIDAAPKFVLGYQFVFGKERLFEYIWNVIRKLKTEYLM